jgi:23S rRNA (uracil1939-C5)-methyltransferase
MKLLQKVGGIVARLGKDGAGEIDRLEGKPLRVYGTIPGETVVGTTLKRGPDGIRTRLDEVSVTSPNRVTPRCPYAGTCGGCKWQHMSYERQLQEKIDRVTRQFSDEDIALPSLTIVAAPDIYFYRNRMDFVFGRHGELGLKEPDRWWSVLDLQSCFLLSPESVEIVNKVRDWAKGTGYTYWDTKTQVGFFRYLVIREGKNTGERMVTLVTTKGTDEQAAKMREIPDMIGTSATSVVWGISDRRTDLSIADEIIPLRGEPWMHETINGMRYKIRPNSFFQTNSTMAAKLQDAVREACGDLDDKVLLDLCCGSGFFSVAFANAAQRVIGVEIDAEAIVSAQENASLNNVSAEFHATPAEKFDWSSIAPDVAIVDPPRGGLHPDVVDTLLDKRPSRVVYVSCSYDRFLKEWIGYDGHSGLSNGYELVAVKALDLFPHTAHVEVVFTLKAK